MKTIIVTGSVGSGKTTLSKKLAKKLYLKYIDVNKLITENKLDSGYDKKRKCKIIDIKKLNNFIINLIKNSKENSIIDSHLSHFLPKNFIDLCIVTKCSLKVLENRLKKRKYPKAKIRENLDCEIFDNCLNEAKALKHKILVINTTKGIKIDEFSKKIKVILK
jgi:adenylate kinase